MNEKNNDAEIREELLKQSGVISWNELVRHFARGVVIKVEPSLDMIEAAIGMARDDTSCVQTWLTEGTLARASDEDARDWSERTPEFMCVVAAPWVLVQERMPAGDVH